MLPTRSHILQILELAKPVEGRVRDKYVQMSKAELSEIGLCVADLCELPRGIFLSTVDNNVVFNKSGLKSQAGLGAGSRAV